MKIDSEFGKKYLIERQEIRNFKRKNDHKTKAKGNFFTLVMF